MKSAIDKVRDFATTAPTFWELQLAIGALAEVVVAMHDRDHPRGSALQIGVLKDQVVKVETQCYAAEDVLAHVRTALSTPEAYSVLDRAQDVVAELARVRSLAHDIEDHRHKAQLEVERLTKELAAMTAARDELSIIIDDVAEAYISPDDQLRIDAARAVGEQGQQCPHVERCPAPYTPLGEIVTAAAARFDERPLYRASVEAQREVAAKDQYKSKNHAPLMNVVEVILNGRTCEFLEGDSLSFERIAELVGKDPEGLTVTFRQRHSQGRTTSGALSPGQVLGAMHGLAINAVHMGNA